MREKKLANAYLPFYESLQEFAFVKEGKSLLPYLFAKTESLLPLQEKEGKIWLATSNAANLDGIQEARLFLQKELVLICASKSALEKAMQKCYQEKKAFDSFPTEEIESKTVSKEESIEGYDLLEQSSQNPVIRLLNVIFIEAISSGASDVHFEPFEDELIVRFRIDGLLQKRYQPSSSISKQLIVRIKVMAKLDIAETRLPQDGRIKLTMGGKEVDFRISTIPTHLGERVVLRLLDKSNVLLGLSKINMPKEILPSFRNLIKSPEGIILVTGPTGSGKTTTLYSAISELNSTEMNIMTIEDPVEYKLPFIAQIGVNPKIDLTFSSGLRHILRQDPDIIMIGEIRDVETAEIAIQASLTGHLVFSTLHTNDAPSAITRLLDMGIEPYLLASSVIGILAQRLVRKICPKCKKPIEKDSYRHFLGPQYADAVFYRGEGCSFCYQTGYLGRCAIYEYMKINSQVKKEIMKKQGSESLRKESIVMSLYDHGLELAKEGITTLEEVLRVVRYTDMDGKDASL